jgi:hypothetical protein
MKPGILLRRILLESMLLFFSLQGLTQSDSLICRSKTSSSLRISWNSSLIYPGIRFGIEIPVYSVNLTRNTHSGSDKSILKERFVSANSGWYHHPDFHDNLYFTTEWTMRRTYKSGFFTDFNIGAGYSRTFLGGTTYKVDNNGMVNIVKAAGYNHALIIAGESIGFDLSEKMGIPFSLFSKLDFLTMFPFNSTIYFRPLLEFGLKYKPEKFIQVSTKKWIRKK